MSSEKIQELIMDPEFSLKGINCISCNIGLCFWLMSDGLPAGLKPAITYGAFTGGIIMSSILMYGYLKENRNDIIENYLQFYYFLLSLSTSWIFFGVATTTGCSPCEMTVNPYSIVYGAALISTVATGIDLLLRKIK